MPFLILFMVFRVEIEKSVNAFPTPRVNPAAVSTGCFTVDFASALTAFITAGVSFTTSFAVATASCKGFPIIGAFSTVFMTGAMKFSACCKSPGFAGV